MPIRSIFLNVGATTAGVGEGRNMTNQPNGKGLSRIAIFNQRSKAFPNARLAIGGLILSTLYPGLATVLWLMEKPLADYLRQVPDGMLHWRRFFEVANFVLFVLFVAMLVGLTIFAFATYRAYRDYLRGKRKSR